MSDPPAKQTRWLLVRGRGERPLDAPIDQGAIRTHSSSKRPSVAPGELAVLYAAVWQAIFAVVEIASEVADGPYSVILEQVANGVAVRMAVLYLLAGGVEDEAAA